MANVLTGDFNAVVQISLRTVYRLLATIHQNSEANTAPSGSAPRLPHRLTFRVDGTKGWFTAQLGVPALELVPGSEMAQGSPGRVVVTCRVRARFERDFETTPQKIFPGQVQFIHGQARATFAIGVEPIAEGMGLRLTPSNNDAEFAFESAELTGSEQAWVTERLRKFIRSWSNNAPFVAALGTPPFELRAKGLGSDVIAIPLDLPGGQAAPSTMASISQVFLGGSHVAIGIGKDYVLSWIQPELDKLKDWHPTKDVPLPSAIPDAHYHVTVTEANPPEWHGNGSTATIPIHVEGTAHDDIYPDVKWSVGVAFTIGFDTTTGVFTISASEPQVNVSFTGTFKKLWELFKVDEKAEKKIRDEVKNKIKEVLGMLAPSLEGALPGQEKRVEDLLRAVDNQATVQLKPPPDFGPDGIVLGGTVKLSPRKEAPDVTIETLPDGSGYSGFANWFPGGWIERYEWKWTWWEVDPLTGLPANAPVASTEPTTNLLELLYPEKDPSLHSESESFEDRFILLESALPGLPKTGSSSQAPSGADSSISAAEALLGILKPPLAGHLCLTISGVQVDPVTGQEVDYVKLHASMWGIPQLEAYFSEQIEKELIGQIGPGSCWEELHGHGHGPPFPYPPLDLLAMHPDPPEQVWHRQWWVEPETKERWRVAEFDLLARPGQISPTTRTTNVLAQFLSEGAGEAPLQAIAQALRMSGQSSRGVVVLLVVQEGTSTRLGRAFAESVRTLGRDLPGVQVLVMEDMRRSWSRMFDVAPDAWARGATRLVDAYGRLAMRHDGPADPDALAATLTERLAQSAPQRGNLFAVHATARDSAPDFFFDIAPGQRVALRHIRGQPVILAFAQPWSVPCLAALRQLQRAHEQAGPGGATVIGVIAEEDAQALEKLRRDHGLTFAIAPDPRRKIARTYEIHAWPTIVTIDPAGEVRARIGVDRGAILASFGSASGASLRD
jgi:peroxiredoxin